MVEAPGVEPGSGSAPLMSLRACPAIWFSSLGWPTGGASWRLAIPEFRDYAGWRCVVASPRNDRSLGPRAPPQVAAWFRFLGGQGERVVVRSCFFCPFLRGLGRPRTRHELC